ncbi:AarF/ABC1/UbiB kinase family protein [Hoeflea sp. AS60]|uniref:ABC1 kinase family protein n=1 Tax=Hoeflea sp. AS60 TaxID=3135780 RepID=UPI00316F2809
MSDKPGQGRPSPVPSHRLSRLAGFGLLTAGIATRTMFEGARRLSRGELPTPADLLITPTNILRVSDELARMRGAALKLGQLLSMDAGDFLPRELAELMARLRADADFMPPQQLNSVLVSNWGPGWRARFNRFDMRPLAAASIGQVHRATTVDGRELAIKVQYPGVARSIDSDIDNVVSLFRLTGLAPPKARLESLIAEAKKQLHEEADYIREADNIKRFTEQLRGIDGFVMPVVQEDFSTGNILAMTFVPGLPIETSEGQSQDIRDRTMTRLIRLALDELFSFAFVQTDPNFANYSYDAANGTIGLLDFGAAKELSAETVSLYRQLLCAGLEGDQGRIAEIAVKLGLYNEQTRPHHRTMIIEIITLVFDAARRRPTFDFANDQLLQRLRSMGTDMALDQSFDQIPPVEVLYLQRKAAGLYLLGRRLRASVPLLEILRDYTHDTVPPSAERQD